MRIHHAAGNFQLDGVRADAILLHHHELLVGCDGDDIDPANGVENEKLMFLAGARIDAGVGADFENAKITDGFAADFLPRFNHKSNSFLLGRPTLTHQTNQMLQGFFVRPIFFGGQLLRAFV